MFFLYIFFIRHIKVINVPPNKQTNNCLCEITNMDLKRLETRDGHNRIVLLSIVFDSSFKLSNISFKYFYPRPNTFVRKNYSNLGTE